MIGAVTGDIVGSICEFMNTKMKVFPLFRDIYRFTDDTVLSVALAESLQTGEKVTTRDYCRRYQEARYGGTMTMFVTCLQWPSFQDNSQLY